MLLILYSFPKFNYIIIITYPSELISYTPTYPFVKHKLIK